MAAEYTGFATPVNASDSGGPHDSGQDAGLKLGMRKGQMEGQLRPLAVRIPEAQPADQSPVADAAGSGDGTLPDRPCFITKPAMQSERDAKQPMARDSPRVSPAARWLPISPAAGAADRQYPRSTIATPYNQPDLSGSEPCTPLPPPLISRQTDSLHPFGGFGLIHAIQT